MFLYSYKSDNMYDEKIEFLRLLYHDRRGGNMIRFFKQHDVFNDGGSSVTLSTNDIDQLANTGTDNGHYYTSVNTFRGKRRLSEQVFCYCSIYIDLDCHFPSEEKIIDAKRRTVALLEEAYSSGTLLPPTMITDTGRGYGLQYVLKSSIANTRNTARQLGFFKSVRLALYEAYDSLMSKDTNAATADPAVLDDSRVCRIPGTYNPSARNYCRLIYATHNYFELNELVQGCHLWDWKSNEDYLHAKQARVHSSKKTVRIINFSQYQLPFLQNRLEQLDKLISLRGAKCTNSCREQLLFITYSALTQLDHDSAALELQNWNAKFLTPLAQAELDHIVKETDSDPKGFYKLPDEYLIKSLGMTPEEIDQTGVGKSWKRNMQKLDTSKRREELQSKIISLLKQTDPQLTYIEIANLAHVSRRKVCMIAKDVGITRYKRHSKAATETSHNCGSGQSAKNLIESVCVDGFTDFQESLISHAAISINMATDDVVAPLSSSELDSVFAKYLAVDRPSVIVQSVHRMYLESFKDSTLSALVTNRLCQSMAKYPHVSEVERINLQVADMNAISFMLINYDYHMSHAALPVSTDPSDTSTMAKLTKSSLPYNHNATIDDLRFEIIDRSVEYKRRLNESVFLLLKNTFMQVRKLRRESFMIHGQAVPTQDIQACFNSMTYKDIVIVCERMASTKTVLHAKKPFFYMLQTIWNYKHPLDFPKTYIQKDSSETKSLIDYDQVALTILQKRLGIK